MGSRQKTRAAALLGHCQALQDLASGAMWRAGDVWQTIPATWAAYAARALVSGRGMRAEHGCIIVVTCDDGWLSAVGEIGSVLGARPCSPPPCAPHVLMPAVYLATHLCISLQGIQCALQVVHHPRHSFLGGAMMDSLIRVGEAKQQESFPEKLYNCPSWDSQSPVPVWSPPYSAFRQSAWK